MKCPCCDKEIEPHQMDVAFNLPDAIFELSKEQRDTRAKTHTDLCSLDDKQFYIRGVIYLPVQQLSFNFGWGVWAEVSEDTFYKYLQIYEIDGSNESPSAGVLANLPPDYSKTRQPPEIHFGPSDKRPVFTPAPSESEFYTEYIGGLTVDKWHSIVDQLCSPL